MCFMKKLQNGNYKTKQSMKIIKKIQKIL
jgi:hypothetical protein